VTDRRARVDCRLVDAVTRVAATDGVAALTVERVLLVAGVSRASFYQYFRSVEECFLSAYRLHAQRLVSEVRVVVECAPDVEVAVLDVLVEMARSRPDVARLLAIEGLASGPRGLTERQALIGALGHLIEVSPRRRVIGVPAVVLIGGAMRYLAMRLAAGDLGASVVGEVRDWVGGFACDERSCGWQLGGFGIASGYEPGPSLPATGRFVGEGGSRERVLRAAAAGVCGEGYRACSVTGVVSAAGVSRRFFYDHFEDKRAAVLAAYEYCYERVLVVCAPAFFASGAWEDRVWRAGVAFARFFAREPLFGHLGFGQTYALGPSFAGRVEEFHLAFTWFMDGRQHYEPRNGATGGKARSVLTACMVAELALQALWQRAAIGMLALLPLVMYVVLTPFTGRDRASAFVQSKLERQIAHSASRGRGGEPGAGDHARARA
jgi:AcrR family transcriptional regulator